MSEHVLLIETLREWDTDTDPDGARICKIAASTIEQQASQIKQLEYSIKCGDLGLARRDKLISQLEAENQRLKNQLAGPPPDLG